MIKNEKNNKKNNWDNIIRNIFKVNVSLYGMLGNILL